LTGFAVLGLLLAAALPAGAEDKPQDKKVELTKAAADAINAAFPGAKIEKIKLEDEDGVKVFEVELELKDGDVEVTVSPDGVIAEVETEITVEALPKAVADALAKVAEGGKIKEVTKEEERATVKDGKLVTLDTPTIKYCAEVVKGETKMKVEIAADGKVLTVEKKPAEKGEKDGDDDDDDDDDAKGEDK
jgi:phosphopantothenoylcysteine synthetase/decarboxylase